MQRSLLSVAMHSQLQAPCRPPTARCEGLALLEGALGWLSGRWASQSQRARRSAATVRGVTAVHFLHFLCLHSSLHYVTIVIAAPPSSSESCRRGASAFCVVSGWKTRVGKRTRSLQQLFCLWCLTVTPPANAVLAAPRCFNPSASAPCTLLSLNL